MKKMLCVFAFVLLALNSNITLANAETPDSDTSKNLIYGLLNEQIHDAVTDYYKSDSARYRYFLSKDAITVDQSEKGNNLPGEFTVKLKIEVQNDDKIVGQDTLDFAVTSGATGKDYKGTKIELLNYNHNKE